MSTLQDVVDQARLDLNDATSNPETGEAIDPRYPDADLLVFANDGISRILVMRPDLNFGNYSTAYTDLTLSDPFPLPAEYRSALVSYVVARNQSGDDAFLLQQRADKSMADFIRSLGIG